MIKQLLLAGLTGFALLAAAAPAKADYGLIVLYGRTGTNVVACRDDGPTEYYLGYRGKIVVGHGDLPSGLPTSELRRMNSDCVMQSSRLTPQERRQLIRYWRENPRIPRP